MQIHTHASTCTDTHTRAFRCVFSPDVAFASGEAHSVNARVGSCLAYETDPGLFNKRFWLWAWICLFQLCASCRPVTFLGITMSWRAESNWQCRGMLLMALWHPFEQENQGEQELWTMMRGQGEMTCVLQCCSCEPEAHLHPKIPSLSCPSSYSTLVYFNIL